MRRQLYAVSLFLLIASCSRNVPEENTTAIVIPEGGYQKRIEMLPIPARDAVFCRAIHDAGRDCQDVRSSKSLGTINNGPAWSVQCRNGSVWLILIGKQGISQVISAAEAEQGGLIKGSVDAIR